MSIAVKGSKEKIEVSRETSALAAEEDATMLPGDAKNDAVGLLGEGRGVDVRGGGVDKIGCLTGAVTGLGGRFAVVIEGSLEVLATGKTVDVGSIIIISSSDELSSIAVTFFISFLAFSLDFSSALICSSVIPSSSASSLANLASPSSFLPFAFLDFCCFDVGVIGLLKKEWSTVLVFLALAESSGERSRLAMERVRIQDVTFIFRRSNPSALVLGAQECICKSLCCGEAEWDFVESEQRKGSKREELEFKFRECTL